MFRKVSDTQAARSKHRANAFQLRRSSTKLSARRSSDDTLTVHNINTSIAVEEVILPPISPLVIPSPYGPQTESTAIMEYENIKPTRPPQTFMALQVLSLIRLSTTMLLVWCNYHSP